MITGNRISVHARKLTHLPKFIFFFPHERPRSSAAAQPMQSADNMIAFVATLFVCPAVVCDTQLRAKMKLIAPMALNSAALSTLQFMSLERLSLRRTAFQGTRHPAQFGAESKPPRCMSGCHWWRGGRSSSSWPTCASTAQKATRTPFISWTGSGGG